LTHGGNPCNFRPALEFRPSLADELRVLLGFVAQQKSRRTFHAQGSN
jgi:hypothetical protein